MTRAEILKKYPDAVDYKLADIAVIHTGGGYYARFDEVLDFYFGKYDSLFILKAELMKYQVVMAA